MLDWFASALAGKQARPVEAIARFAESMGPADGPSEVLIHRRLTSPLTAAVANAASSHFAEQDDLHNGSVFHPGTVVFPVALAVAQALVRSGAEKSSRDEAERLVAQALRALEGAPVPAAVSAVLREVAEYAVRRSL